MRSLMTTRHCSQSASCQPTQQQQQHLHKGKGRAEVCVAVGQQANERGLLGPSTHMAPLTGSRS